ncbi:helix-turn-helix domain-containing protein [Cupriavidus basilensis]|uniref:Helix-turn-helix domain-containing protein n=1 Tax=Cupriavidus basilensis TaxID=68895 RepID=A0ABT6B1Y0_9BURK|nr:helix-turn-helix domain-containing protein [Cupriavidus basilensis]MDF3838885.1 helix-turn-helix domain-containing protein [Cupriavidus basilensis]
MQRKPLGDAPCPIARSLARVGEPWNILILREAFYGLSRFDEFQKQLGIAPNMLARRLDSLVRDGLLARRQYCDRPPRWEYLLTTRGREFRPVMLALLAWGNRHFAPEGESIQLVDRHTGATVTPLLVDAANGNPITEADHRIAAGPAASERLRARLEKSAAARAAAISHVPRPAGVI